VSPSALLRAPGPRRPGRLGPGPIPAPAVDALDLVLRRHVAGVLPGERRAPGVGLGAELAQLRPYEPGDDVRHLDPAASARTRVPHVRVHVPERELATWLLLDTSPSMAWGTADRQKADVAEGVALVIGRLATRRGNRLGVMVFGGDVGPRALRPRQGRAGLLALFAALRGDPPADGGGAGALAAALSRTGALASRRGLVVVVSDFGGPRDWERPLRRLSARHAVLAVEVRDPREEALPDVGHVWLVDPETGRQLQVDTARRRVRERYAAAAAAERREMAAAVRRAGADHVVLSTAGDWLGPLAARLRTGRGGR
jgi:uncharacterized protein (DUF58 family)